MVALTGFFQPGQVFLEFFLVGKRRRIEPLQHGVGFTAAPIGPRHTGQLECLEQAGGRDVGTATEIDKGALAVQRNFGFVKILNQFDLVVFAHRPEQGNGVVPLHHLTDNRQVGRGQFRHLLFDQIEIFRTESMGFTVEIVIKTAFDGRTDGHLNLRAKQFLDGMRHQVRRRMAIDIEPFGSVQGNQLEAGILFNRCGGVNQAVIQAGRNGLSSQTGADAMGNLQRRGPLINVFDAAVGQADLDLGHTVFL